MARDEAAPRTRYGRPSYEDYLARSRRPWTRDPNALYAQPCSTAIGKLAAEFRDLPVVLDHLGRAGQGTPAEYDNVLALAKLPRVVMKFSGWAYSSKEPPPHKDIVSLMKRTYDAFGPDRIIWGGLGHNAKQFENAVNVFEVAFGFANEGDRAKIRGSNAKNYFGLDNYYVATM